MVNSTQALLDTQDLLDRCQVRFFALKDTANQIKQLQENQMADLTVSTIELGVQKKDLNEGTLPILKDMMKLMHLTPEITDGLIRFEVLGVPVVIKIIDRRYRFLENPTQVFFRYATFNLPNPWENYWTARHIVR